MLFRVDAFSFITFSTSYLHVVRALGVDASQLGASLSIVPSLTQYVTGTTYFVTYTYGDSFQVPLLST